MTTSDTISRHAGPSSPSQTRVASSSFDLSASAIRVKSLLDQVALDDLQSLVDATLLRDQQTKQQQREVFLSHTPALLSLDSELQGSIASLDSLSSFLTTFSTDLGSVSHQISSLKEKSNAIEEQLKVKRALEEPLGKLLDGGLLLDPEVVETIFEGEPDRSWVGIVQQLDRSIEATRKPLDQLAATSTPGRPSGSRRTSLIRRGSSALATQPEDGPSNQEQEEAGFRALKEARVVAEACKAMAAAKIRTHLLKPLELVRASVSTNLQVLQTSVLLPHHQPLYSFLARQMPRVAIDVQRAYVAAARLYFETGFRRYARSLSQIKKKGYTGKGGVGNIIDPNGGGLSGLIGAGSKSADDQWITDPQRLENANFDGPSVTLGYQGDSTSYTAPPEALYRSLTLVFFDNACSEYAFIVRYFEALASSTPHRRVHHSSSGTNGRGSSRIGSDGPLSPPGSVPPTPISETDEYSFHGDEDGPAPSESASVIGGTTGPPLPGDSEGDLVQLSRSEQAALKGRGAADELFKKIFEPVIGTWLAFSRALLAPTPPPLMPLLCMIQLTDQLLNLATARGTASVLTGPLLQFKMEAWPLFQKQLQEEIETVARLAGETVSSAASSSMMDFGGWMKSASATLGAASGLGKTTVDQTTIALIATRYASLYSQIAHLSSTARLPESLLSSRRTAAGNELFATNPVSSSFAASSEEDSSALMLFSSLLRLRNALERLIQRKATEVQKASGGKEAEAKRLKVEMGSIVKEALEKGPADLTLQRIQSELGYWVELSRRTSTTRA